MDLAAVHEPGVVAQELRRARVAVALGRPPRRGEQEGKGHVGRCAVEDAGRIAYGDAPRGGGGNVDMIDPDAVVADDAHAAQAVEHGAVNGDVPVGVNAVNGFLAAREGDFPGSQATLPAPIGG